MVFSTSSYRLDPERFIAEVVRCKSSNAFRLEVEEMLTEAEFRSLGALFSRFLDLTVSVKDLTHRAWTLDFLLFFPQTRGLQLKCLWSLDSLAPVSTLHELTRIELGSLLNGEVSLEPLIGLKKVKSCSVSGKWNDLFFLMKLQSLEKIVLSGFSQGEFDFIAELSQLRELEILDSTLQELITLRSDAVRSLKLSNLRQLSDLSWVVNFPNLRHLKLKSLPKVDRLPPQDFLDQLESFCATHLRSAGIRNTVELQKREEGLFVL